MNNPLLYSQLRCQLLHPAAILPTRGTDGSAGLDLYAASFKYEQNVVVYETFVSVEIPTGYVGLMFARSSISSRNLRMATGASVIDSDFRGTIKVKFDLLDQNELPEYEMGDRIAQLVIVPYLHLTPVEVDSLSDTERGSGGFGSTGSREQADAELKSYTQAVTE